MDTLIEITSNFPLATDSAPIRDAITFVSSIFVLIVVTAIIFVLAMRAGRAMLIALILALYVGFAIYTFFPYTNQIIAAAGDAPMNIAIAGMALYAVFSFTIYILIRRTGLLSGASIRALPLFILALLTGGFILALGYHTFHLGDVYPLTNTLKPIFAPAQYFFWWFIAPLVGMFFLAR